MKTVKDKAIILRRKSFGEADWMLTLFTQNHGKVRAVAKGARKINSRLSGFVELFTIISCQLNFHTSIPIISQVSHEQLFDGVAENQELYRSLHVIAEVVDKATHEDDVQPGLFYLITQQMSRLVTDDRSTTLSECLVALTKQFGLVPQVDVCAICGKQIEEGELVEWDVSHGGVVHSLKSNNLLTGDEVKVLRALVAQRLPKALRISDELTQRVERYLLDHLQFSLDQMLVSAKVS